MLMSSKVLREVGRWDESLLLYGEETDFALRARAAGHVLRYEPRSEMVHLSGDAYATNPELFALMAVNKVVVYRRWHGHLRSSAFFGAVTLGVAVRAAAGRRTARRGLTALVRPATRLSALPG